MQLSGEGYYRRRLARVLAHGVLRVVYIRYHIGKRTVVADGAREHIGDIVPDERLHDARADVVLLDIVLYSARFADKVYRVQVMVVPVRDIVLCVYVLPEPGVEQIALEVVRREGVARKERVAVAVVDERLHGGAGVVVEHAGGTQHPDYLAVVSVVAQNIIEAVVVAGIRSFAALSHPERERLIDAVLRGGETVRVNEDAVPAVVRAVDDYLVALFYVPHLNGVGHAVFYHDGAVHAAASEHLPLAVYLEIFGVYCSRVKILRDVAVPGFFGRHIGE